MNISSLPQDIIKKILIKSDVSAIDFSAINTKIQKIYNDNHLKAYQIACQTHKIAKNLREDTALASSAKTMGILDPERGLEITSSIKDAKIRIAAKFSIAETLAKKNLPRALEIVQGSSYDKALILASAVKDATPYALEEILKIIETLEGESNKSIVLVRVIESLALTDPERALSLIESMQDHTGKSLALTLFLKNAKTFDLKKVVEIVSTLNSDRLKGPLAKMLAETHVEEALECTSTIKEEPLKEEVTAHIAEIITKTDYKKALLIVNDIQNDSTRKSVKANIAGSMALTNLKGALKIANSAPNIEEKVFILAAIVKAVAAKDFTEALGIAFKVQNRDHLDMLIANVVEGMASAEPEKALNVMKSINSSLLRDQALKSIPAALALLDLKRAMSIATKMNFHKNEAIALIAEAIKFVYPEKALKVAQYIHGHSALKESTTKSAAKALIELKPEKALRTLKITECNAYSQMLSDRVEEIAKTDLPRALKITRPYKGALKVELLSAVVRGILNVEK